MIRAGWRSCKRATERGWETGPVFNFLSTSAHKVLALHIKEAAGLFCVQSQMPDLGQAKAPMAAPESALYGVWF
jgi:hypothetical protein